METISSRYDHEHALREIDALDLEAIRFQLTHDRGDFRWSAERVASAELGYRRYLKLRVLHPDVMIPPTRDADQFWHNHILDTRKYAEDCERVFGHFLHHFPYFGVQGDEDAAQHAAATDFMREQYEREFGESVDRLGDWEQIESVQRSEAQKAAWKAARDIVAVARNGQRARRSTVAAFCG
ncbi:hypothetical protein OOT46_10740 [Aquabacterium sp. A7-Y]|uniref:glycine-rich domain-containing protein n=1 Tax=Aquabacterium sp. A7-Y TaxID=1349605 RepID=UPI00223E1416|nr:hypothetical protein [Aquabacterium sp. A7-Y]MCW7538316.1 hypothetical protein [Aquabacterium sp. A7-Y]